MTIQHPLALSLQPFDSFVLESLWQAIETEDETTFLTASQAGILQAALPEWKRMKGPYNTQHRNHDFTLDVHTAKVVVKTRRSPYFKALTPHWKRLVTVAALLHDIAKDAGSASERNTISPDALHPLKGAGIVRRTLPAWGFSLVDTFCVAALIRYHQLFGHMIICHNRLGHPPTEDTFLEHAQRFPDELFLNALLPLTEGDIRAVKADDAIFNADVEQKLYQYSEGVRASIQAIHRTELPVQPVVDEATQLAMYYGKLHEYTLHSFGGHCTCGLENIDTPLRFAFQPTSKDLANAYALCAFTEYTHPTDAWWVRNPFPLI
jgi:hypothetical protein